MNEEATNQNDDLEVIDFAGKYKFQKPVIFEGTTFEEVSYDLESLKAGDIISCRKEAIKIRGQASDSIITDDILHAVTFARAADLPAGFILEMGAADYAAWATIAQGFFASGLSGLSR